MASGSVARQGSVLAAAGNISESDAVDGLSLSFPSPFAWLSPVLGRWEVRASSCLRSCFAPAVLNVAGKASEKFRIVSQRAIVAHSEKGNPK